MEENILLKGGAAEIKVKGSRFIATVNVVNTREDAIELINNIKKARYDATHNCVAYITDNGRTEYCNDDGEPSGTAGRPMLEVLKGKKCKNILAIVTRYFGGTLLGTGGLVRAYSDSLKAAMEKSVFAVIKKGSRILISMDYTFQGKVMYLLNEENAKILKEEYNEKVNIEAVIDETMDEDCKNLIEKIMELSSGKIKTKHEKIDYLETNEGITII